MARLVGFIGNRPDLGARAIELEKRDLTVHKKPDVVPGWGVGFYQGGEILLKRRPIDDREEIRVADMTKDVRADILIAHVRSATVGPLRTENTHPFRYRQWLFAHTGTIESFSSLRPRLVDSLPQFLQRDVRGDTDSELLFHLFLSFLHDNTELDRPSVPAASARNAIRSCISLVDRLCAEDGAAPTAMNMLISNPDYLLAVHGGMSMAYRTYQGSSDLERIFGEGGLHRMRMPDYAMSKLTLVAADFDNNRPPTGWNLVPDRSIVTFSRSDAPVLEAI